MSTHPLIKHLSPEDRELETKLLELAGLDSQLAGKELQFEELKLSLAAFQRRYFQEVGRKYIELDEVRAEIAEANASERPYNPEIQD